MKYLLKNIARNSLIRTILFVLVGLFFWSIRFYDIAQRVLEGDTLFLAENGPIVTIVGFLLVAFNSLLYTFCLYRTGITNLPSIFVGTTAWLLLSAFSLWHIGWQVHLMILLFLITAMVIAKINIQHEAKEQAYTLALLFCVFSPHLIVTCVGVLYVAVHLLARSRFTWKVLLALVLGVATYLLYAVIFRYFDWFQALWLENLPFLVWWEWTIAIVAYILTGIICYLPIAKPSFLSGAIYILGILGAIVAGIMRIMM